MFYNNDPNSMPMFPPQFYGNPPRQTPMSTPDDPVIHNSPPSLRGVAQQSQPQIQQGGYGGTVSQSESRNSSCDSPSAEGSNDERNRRSKTCRVCGDHATGYNFNVITCESCKAFFRRNALRPKEFKCPYSDDCEINSVSRRFCQKCRLRKCFIVGMKKEWILNEEQLRRRKNSRLNNMSGQHKHRMMQQSSGQQQMENQNINQSQQQSNKTVGPPEQLQFVNNGVSPPLISPTPSSYVLSPASGTSSTPVSSPATNPGSLNDYEPNLLLQQRLAQQRLAQTLVRPPAPQIQPTRVSVDPFRNQVTMTMDEYAQLVQMASSRPIAEIPPPPLQAEEPPLKRTQLDATIQMQTKPYAATITTQSLSAFSNFNENNQYADVPKMFQEGFQDRMASFFDQTIIDALNVDSPDGPPNPLGGTRPGSVDILNGGDVRANYQLNIAELRELDMVRAAFSGMNDPMESEKQKMTFMKDKKTPTDIMNIMDITMRRLVKMAKKLPVFNELSQDGKFNLLKGGMVEMLTVRGVTRYDEQAGCWRTPMLPTHYKVPINMFDNLKEGVREVQKERFLQFFRTLNDDLRKNDLAIDLLMLIVLFTPRSLITNPNDQMLVERQHNDYTALLYRYLESLYGDDSRRFHEMIPKALEMLKIISSNTANLFMGKVNKEEAEDLPKEFFPVE